MRLRREKEGERGDRREARGQLRDSKHVRVSWEVRSGKVPEISTAFSHASWQPKRRCRKPACFACHAVRLFAAQARMHPTLCQQHGPQTRAKLRGVACQKQSTCASPPFQVANRVNVQCTAAFKVSFAICDAGCGVDHELKRTIEAEPRGRRARIDNSGGSPGERTFQSEGI